MPITQYGKPFEDFTAKLEERGYRATNHHSFKVPQGSLVLFGLVRSGDVLAPLCTGFVARFYPDGDFQIWLEEIGNDTAPILDRLTGEESRKRKALADKIESGANSDIFYDAHEYGDESASDTIEDFVNACGDAVKLLRS